MKRFIILIIAYTFFLSTGIACAEVLIKPNDANINYYGRFDFSNSATAVTFNWPGAIIEASFPGQSIGVELSDGGSSYFDVEIDGVKKDSLPPTTVTHRTISTTLSNATHTIRIILRTNGYNCSFGGFYLANGNALAAKPAQPTRKMEFIGDSWTAGDVTLQPPGGSTTYPQDFDASLTYARQTSLAFHAQDKLIARGGRGMVVTTYGTTVPSQYPKILCDGTANWDFTTWTPNVVCIFLGINDFNNGATDANFRTGYTTFINTVRSHYTNVPIILIGLPDNFSGGQNIWTDVQAVAKSFTNIYTFLSPVTLATAGAMYQHPTPAQHKLISDSLIRVIKLATGWDTTAPTGISVPDIKQKTQNVSGANQQVVKTSQDKIVFQSRLSGMLKEVVAYDCSGQPLRKIVTGEQTLSISRDFGLHAGMYIIKTTVLR